ncbi:hypothetical protein BDA96_02G022200 [Sorghum bicolor]|uniref:Phytosulfokine n=1 Tax=Sorghum bicolor TaxID=4558 RepID=A0A921RKU5_SORBI|nr:hypothetical protein BDA96_02G022200 [Sorghum bicolor]
MPYSPAAADVRDALRDVHAATARPPVGRSVKAPARHVDVAVPLQIPGPKARPGRPLSPTISTLAHHFRAPPSPASGRNRSARRLQQETRKAGCSVVHSPTDRPSSMAKRATVMVLAAALAVLLLAAASSAPVASAARDDPAAAAAAVSSSHDQKQGSAAEGGCEGANDEDECMMRRTLNAHTDYIYTQQHHN